MYLYPRRVRSPLALAVVMTLVACAAPREGPLPAGRSPTETARESPQPGRTAPAASGPERYVAIGASDAAGVGAADPRTGSWPARIAAKLPQGSTYTNLGVSGSLAAQARTQQSPAAIAARPTLVTIWLAVNDLNNGISSTEYRDVVAGILAELVSRTEARIFIGNVPDLTAVPVYRNADPAVLGAQVAAYNRWIAETAARYPGRVSVVDLWSGSAALVSTATVSADGFHPSDGGYQLIADRFIAAMRRAGIALSS